MVVTRRTPAPPVAASRTASAQPIPRLGKKAPNDASSAPEKPSPLSNGSNYDAAGKKNDAGVGPLSGAGTKSAKPNGKQRKKKGERKNAGGSTSFTELLFRAFLLWFTIYTLSVCPQDEQLKTPVCRGLAEYRRLVIEPYILPPIQQALSHPSVSPYVEKARPYADYAVRTAKPLAARAQKVFNSRVVPQWNKRVVPLYYTYAAPQLLKLDAQVSPYRTRAEQEYERVLAPYIRRTATTLYQWQHQARPYIIFATEKAYQGYQTARPYARPVWEKVQVVLAHVAAFLGEQRRQFVDPHVQKIWDHVKEMSNGKPGISATPMRSSVSPQVSKASSQISKGSVKISSSLSSVASTAVSGAAHVSGASNSGADSTYSVLSVSDDSSAAQTAEAAKSTASAAVEDTPVVTSSSLQSTASSSSIVSVATDAAASSASSPAESATPLVDGQANTASSISQDTTASSLVESATTAGLDAVSQDSPTASSTSADQQASVADNLNVPDAASPVTVTETLAVPETDRIAPTSAPETDPEDSLFTDPDMQLFEELGLMDDFLSDDVPEDPTEPEVDLEAEREREAQRRARAERTAEIRADIEGRHAQWEKQVEESIAVNKKALRKSLVAIRKAAVAELKQNVAIREEIEGLMEDAEKFLRGAEKYLANLQKEKRTLEEKQIVWERVLGKLDEKFQERLGQTEAIVNGWYHGVLSEELTLVKRLTDEVKEIADQGQADIGLDYAYLDDVTVQDWTRYHDLIRRSENFTTLAQSVQDGSHPSPPINPVVPALQDLQAEVEDVISGYNARLRKVKRSGVRAFGSADEAAGDEEDGSASILPIEEPEQTGVGADVPPVVVGRGKEEVEAALNRVAEAEGRKVSSPDEPEQSKNTVATEETSESAPLHQEL